MREKPIRLLLVEDDPDDVWMVRNLLRDRWDTPFELVEVGLLSAAIERCRENADVILLDLSLPDSRGMDTFFSLYAHAVGIPIVILTGFGDEATAVKAVRAGAQDYLVKGDVSDQGLVRSIRYAIERNRRQHAQESAHPATRDTIAVQEVQMRLHPETAPEAPGFDIAGGLYPAREAASDYFDYVPMRDGCVGIVIGDVSSHGVGPALLMSATRTCLRTLAQAHDDVGDILTRANQMLAIDEGEFHFVTLVMARLNPGAMSLAYASAGQRGYILHPGLNVTILDSTSLPLSVCAGTVVPTAPAITLQRGDLLVFFTNGVTAAESLEHTRFGVARVLQAIRTNRDKTAQEIVTAIYQEVRNYCGGQPLADDVTLLVVKTLEA